LEVIGYALKGFRFCLQTVASVVTKGWIERPPFAQLPRSLLGRIIVQELCRLRRLRPKRPVLLRRTAILRTSLSIAGLKVFAKAVKTRRFMPAGFSLNLAAKTWDRRGGRHDRFHLQIIFLAIPGRFFLMRPEIAYAPHNFIAF
jgi:hypothetical protein